MFETLTMEKLSRFKKGSVPVLWVFIVPILKIGHPDIMAIRRIEMTKILSENTQLHMFCLW